MKPRSRTGTLASSSGRNVPFRKTMLASLLEPEPQCIPGPAKEARRRHRLEREQRKLLERLALEAHAQGADALALRDRRDEGLLREQLRLELLALAFRHRHHHVGLEPGLHALRRALPHV